ncbi:hypothetical protein V5O48_008668 [Marasmius crinis-equi]|uniref:HMG box domain-containing protein n=1 Tax=Marasmius crinis-equi TaxID=585013 RepID=A0ABR3FDG4_9AGAR
MFRAIFRAGNGLSISVTFLTSIENVEKKNPTETPKASRMFKANFLASAKHHFAKEYIELHGPTTKYEMKELWANVPPEKRAIYQALANNVKRIVKRKKNNENHARKVKKDQKKREERAEKAVAKVAVREAHFSESNDANT